MNGDATHPASETCAVGQLMQVTKRRNERVLKHVVDVARAPQQTSDARAYTLIMTHVQRVLRRTLASKGVLNELYFVHERVAVWRRANERHDRTRTGCQYQGVEQVH